MTELRFTTSLRAKVSKSGPLRSALYERLSEWRDSIKREERSHLLRQQDRSLHSLLATCTAKDGMTEPISHTRQACCGRRTKISDGSPATIDSLRLSTPRRRLQCIGRSQRLEQPPAPTSPEVELLFNYSQG